MHYSGGHFVKDIPGKRRPWNGDYSTTFLLTINSLVSSIATKSAAWSVHKVDGKPNVP